MAWLYFLLSFSLCFLYITNHFLQFYNKRQKFLHATLSSVLCFLNFLGLAEICFSNVVCRNLWLCCCEKGVYCIHERALKGKHCLQYFWYILRLNNMRLKQKCTTQRLVDCKHFLLITWRFLHFVRYKRNFSLESGVHEIN